MRIKKLQAIAFAGMMAVLMTACKKDEPIESPQQQKVAEKAPSRGIQPNLGDMPKKEGLLRVSTTGEQPPFSFRNEFGLLEGIDIDIISAIAKEEGLEVEFFTEPWFEVFPSVVAGKRDIAVSGVSYSDERNANYTLSDSYLFVPSAIMVMEDSGINGVADLAGKKFSCMKAAKQCGDISRLSPRTTVDEVESTFVSFQELVRGETDAIGEDIHLLQYFANNHPTQKVKIIPYETENDPPAQQVMMMAKGNTELAQKINRGIQKLKASGKLQEIEQKWMKVAPATAPKS